MSGRELNTIYDTFLADDDDHTLDERSVCVICGKTLGEHYGDEQCCEEEDSAS